MATKVITDYTEKTAPIAADMALVADSAAANAYKKVRLDNLSIVSALQSLSLQNEVMGFPAMVGIDVDLDAVNQWWDKISTPTTAVTMVDVAGEAGITESYIYALKTTTDASGEGFYQRYTYADQPRIKSGQLLSACAAVWVGTGGTTVTMSLTTSNPTSVTATATAQAWTILRCENLTLDGTYVDLKFTADAADTFYVVPLGVNIGSKSLILPTRNLVYRAISMASLLSLSGKGDENTWTDVDATSSSSNLAVIAQLRLLLSDTADAFVLSVRTNGSNLSSGARVNVISSSALYSENAILLDDGQIFEYNLDRTSGSGNLDSGSINLLGYWEWG